VLKKLEQLHDEVEAFITAQEALLSGGEPPTTDEIARARWKLMAASRRRRDYVDEAIYPALSPILSGDTAGMLAALRERDVAQRHWASAHLADWPIERIEAEFGTYQPAALEVFRRMRAHLRDERNVLMTLLSMNPIEEGR
jgi:hypothetical protein